MRAGEVRGLRLRDLNLTWDKEQITNGEVIVPRSKTAAGTGRLIPLSKRVCASLSFWMGYFPNATPDSYLFPFYQVGIGGDSRADTMYDIDLSRPMGSWRKGWLEACKRAGVSYRWHDRGIPLSRASPRARTFASRPFAPWPGTSAIRCSNTIPTFVRRRSRLRFASSRNRKTSRFCLSMGKEMGGVASREKMRWHLTY
jgi:hypothetical protein